jgi:curli biogenesis system outer membrane secretion channel CsgG
MKMITSQKNRISAKDIMEHPWVQSSGKGTSTALNAQGIKEFYKTGNLKRIFMTAMAFQLSEKEIENLAKIFNELDADGDGQLSYSELMKGSNPLIKALRS